METKLNVIFTIDKFYIQHFTVALTSLLENNKDIDLQVFVIHDIEDIQQLDAILLFFDKTYNLKISLLSLENSLFDHYTLTDHVSKATYFRLMIADIMPPYVDKAIFLDSDIVVTASLKELFEVDMKDKYLFAVKDLDLNSVKRLNDLKIPVQDYFNAGVLLINLKLWRLNNVSQGLIATAKKYMDKLVWWDQDVLNIYLYDKWSQLPAKYNEKNIVKRLKETPVIIHYAGASKPWKYLNNHPYKGLYWKYLRLSPFKNYKYTDLSIKNIIKRIVFFNRSI